MISTVVLFSLLTLAEFSSFTYCHDNTRGPYETQCVQLDAQAKGDIRFKKRDAESVNLPIELSPAARERFLSLLAETRYLENPETFESGKKIANLGEKRLSVDLPSGRREGKFNFSVRKDITDLSSFMEALINQETLGFDITTAMQFERLSIPKRLEALQNELRANRIADPEALTPLLEKIQGDAQILNYARTQAGKIKEQIQAAKKK